MTKAANESYDLIRGTLSVLQSVDTAELFQHLFDGTASRSRRGHPCRWNFPTRVSQGRDRQAE
jgi:hypothetical protein